jgi:hypothetical protein
MITSLGSEKIAHLTAEAMNHHGNKGSLDKAFGSFPRNQCFPFQVITGDKRKRNYILVATDSTQRGQWVEAIRLLSTANSADLMIRHRNEDLQGLFDWESEHRQLKHSVGTLELQLNKGQWAAPDDCNDLLVVGRTEDGVEYDKSSRVMKYDSPNFDLSRHHFAIYCEAETDQVGHLPCCIVPQKLIR